MMPPAQAGLSYGAVALDQRKWCGAGLTALSLLAIGWLTLRPSPEDIELVARSPFLCLYPCGVEGLRDAVLNVVLFIPLGAALATWVSGWRLWLAPLTLSLLIEFSQYQWLSGRDASLRDVLTNTLGGALGVFLARRWHTVFRPARPVARRMAAGGLVAWLGIVTATAIGMRRDLPETTYWGQWAPVLGQFAIYAGTVLNIQVGGEPLAFGRVQDSGELRRLLLQDSVLITATVVSGIPPSDPAPIASVYDGLQQEIFVLGQDHNDLVFRVRNGLVAAELAGQMVRMPDFPGHTPGDTVHIAGGIVRNHYLLRAEARAGTKELWVPFSAGWAWSGLLPFRHRLGPEAALLTALWLGALMFPAGYWLGAGGDGPVTLLWIVGVTGLGLAAATLLSGLPPGSWSEWFGSLSGGLAGWMLGRKAGAGAGPHPPGTSS